MENHSNEIICSLLGDLYVYFQENQKNLPENMSFVTLWRDPEQQDNDISVMFIRGNLKHFAYLQVAYKKACKEIPHWKEPTDEDIKKYANESMNNN